jgi:hypothetical protein
MKFILTIIIILLYIIKKIIMTIFYIKMIKRYLNKRKGVGTN